MMDLYPKKKRVQLLKLFREGEHEKEDTTLLSIDISDQDQGGEPIVVMISLIVALWDEMIIAVAFPKEDETV